MITYNHEPYIGHAIKSTLDQNADFDIEIVIGEDGSTDATRSIVTGMAEQAPNRINLLARTTNVGMMNNLIETYASCRGEYVAFLEGDDYWTDPTKLARQVEVMESNPALSMCFHQSENVNASGRSLKSFHPHHSPPFLGVEDVLFSNPIQTNSILLRRAMLPEIPAFFSRLKLGDWPMCILLAMKGPIAYIDRPMAAYRVHPSSAWSSKSKSHRRLASTQMYLAIASEIPELESAICDALTREIRQIESSLSYKLGFALTSPLRYLLGSSRD